MRKMKDSGIEWIGEIPEDWEVKPIKSLFSFGKGLPITKDNLIENGSSVISYGQIHSKNNIGVQIVDDLKRFVSETYLDTNPNSLVHKGDFIFADTSEDLEGCGNFVYVDKEDILFAGYHTIILFSKQNINNNYLAYLFKTDAWRCQIRGLCSGVKLFSISKKILGQTRIILPMVHEQQQIADFLDEKVSQIDSTITKTRESIEEYKKLKQSIITEAVTKGLNPNAKMKDSEIDWIGEIPEVWEVRRTKYITKAMNKGNGITKDQIVQDGDSPCVRYGEIYSKYDNAFCECITRTNKSLYNVLQYFSFGDILFACTGELPEEIGKNIVYLGNEKCLAGGDIIVLSHSQEPRFLNYVYNSYGQTQKSLGKTKLKVVHISASEIANIVVALPPISEQQQIADYLDKKCSEIDALITKKEQLVVELEAYKKSLIYEVVTGKREV